MFTSYSPDQQNVWPAGDLETGQVDLAIGEELLVLRREIVADHADQIDRARKSWPATEAYEAEPPRRL